MSTPLIKRLSKLNGQLVETSDEELGNLAAAAGRPVIPTNPLEAGVIGANPDAAKMAGVPVNKLNALRQSIREDVDAATVEGRRQDRSTQNAGEQAKAGKAAGLAAPTGSLEGRVQEIANHLFNQPLTAQSIEVNAYALKSKVPDAANLPAAQALAAKLANGTASPSEVIELARLMGITDSAAFMKPEELATKLKDTLLLDKSKMGDVLAGQVQNTITVGESLSAGEIAEAASALGLSVDEVKALSVAAFGEAVKRFQAGDYRSVEELRRTATDPFASPADRAIALRQLREAGATGIRNVESSVEDLVTAAGAANSVTIGAGANATQYTVDELLNDATIAGVVKRYLNGTPEEKAAIEAQWGTGLTGWIKGNEAALTTATAHISDQVAALSKVQEENKAVAQTDAGDLSLDVMKALFPDWGQARADGYALPPLISMLKDPKYPPEARSAIIAGVNGLAAAGLTQDVKDLAGLDYTALSRLGLTSKQAFDHYVQVATQTRQLQELSPEDSLSLLFGDGFDSILADARIAVTAGFASPTDFAFLNSLDADGDGKLDKTDATRAKMLSLLSGGSGTSIASLLKSGLPANTLLSAEEIRAGTARQMDGVYASRPLLAKLRGALADGRIDGQEIRGVDLSPQEAEDLYLHHRKQLVPESEQHLLNTVIRGDWSNRVDTALAAILPGSGATYRSVMNDIQRAPTSYEDAVHLADYLSVVSANLGKTLNMRDTGTAARWTADTARSLIEAVARIEKYKSKYVAEAAKASASSVGRAGDKAVGGMRDVVDPVKQTTNLIGSASRGFK